MIFQAVTLPRHAGRAFTVDHDFIAKAATALQVGTAIDIVIDGPVAIIILPVTYFIGRRAIAQDGVGMCVHGEE